MSEQELRLLNEQLANVFYTRDLKQAEEIGREEGKKEGIEIGEKEGMEKIVEKLIHEKTETVIEERIGIGIREGIEIGIKEGIEEGERNIITKLLEKNTPEEISSQYNIPLEKIQKIQNSLDSPIYLE